MPLFLGDTPKAHCQVTQNIVFEVTEFQWWGLGWTLSEVAGVTKTKQNTGDHHIYSGLTSHESLTTIEYNQVLYYCLFLKMAPPQALQRDVEFRTVDGITLRGFFYAPIGDEKMPCIIMTHGVRLSLNVPVVKVNVAKILFCVVFRSQRAIPPRFC